MKQTFALISTYSSDQFGICSALYELGGMSIIHDASGCNSTYTTHDEPRWYDMDSMVYISALSRNETILGRDSKLIEDILDTAGKYRPKFVAIVGAPVPYMIGTDYKAIAKLVEDKLGIPSFGFDSNGMQYYTRGMRDAFKAIAERFATERTISGSKPGERPVRVNLLGVTPLDFGMTGAVGSLKKWLVDHGMVCNSCFAMGSDLTEIAKAPDADISLVVSYGGTGAAKVLKEKFGVPYVYGIPMDASVIAEKIRERAGDGAGEKTGAGGSAGMTEKIGENSSADGSKDIVIIGEQVYSLSLAEALKDLGIKARVLCQLDRVRDSKVNEEKIEFIYTPEEDDVIRETKEADLVIADPLYGPICGAGKLIELPHMAFSGRMFENDIPNLIGDGEQIYNRIMKELKKTDEQKPAPGFASET
ncbi:MAG: nitrogenase component 1 [Lachnospiraceae bacterium]|nr:nitrogenase component 1 [Lachnospiraceae bacterium]